jgi:hypothetical protein
LASLTVTKEQLEAAHCLEAADQVPKKPQMTEFRRRVRYQQACWRESKGYPIGTHPIAPRKGEKFRLMGSRVPLDYAEKTGANFLTKDAFEAVKERTSRVEANQSFDHQRLWADLLWSQALAFNLFGDLSKDVALADRALRTLWPDAPGKVSEVRFAYSPGRLDPAYLGSLREFDAAFILDMGKEKKGIIGLATKYYEWLKPEIARPENFTRYVEVAERSRAFNRGVPEQFRGRNGLCLTWLEHLLLLSMLQHKSGDWRWGRYVVIFPSGNIDFVEGTAQYRSLLKDQSTFGSMTLEDLLGAPALSPRLTRALRERYVPA